MLLAIDLHEDLVDVAGVTVATLLADLGLSVTLGRLSEDLIDAVVFADAQGPLEIDMSKPVLLGQTFSASLRKGGTLGNTVLCPATIPL